MSDTPKNLALDILRIGEGNLHKTAFIMPGRNISHAEFRSMILMNALHMQARGVQPGSNVAISIGSSHALGLSLFLGCGLLGASCIAGAPDVLRLEKRLTHIFHDEVGFMSDNDRIAKLDATWTRPPKGFDPTKGLHFPGFLSESATQFVAMSSGTTGQRKFIEWTAARFYGYAQEWATSIVGKAQRRASLFPNLSFLKTLHSIGTLLAGGMVVEGASHKEMIENRLDVMFGSPAHFSRFAWTSEGRLPMACISGGVAAPALIEQLLGRFEILRIDYGATEVGSVASADISRTTDDPKCLRTSLAERAIEVVGSDGRVLGVGQMGEIRIKTPFLAGRYRGDEATSKATFKDGWFYPGDLAVLTSDGAFCLKGRAKDQFNIAGVKFNAIEVDQVISTIPGILDAMCFVETFNGLERLAVLVEVSDAADRNDLIVKISKQLAEYRSDAFSRPVVYEVDHIPRNANGKPMRGLAETVDKIGLGN